jgi:glycosyltransferase involved in cell wall biosynthesis
VVNIVAHDLQISIDEHELFYGQGSYPFKHNTDPYLHTLLLKHATGADVIFTPSSTSADWINKNIPNRKRVIVIPHGTEIPDSYLPLPDKFVAGYLGASGPDKGLGYMLSAWEKDPTGEMILGGTCCQFLAESLKLVPARFPNVKLLGWLDKVSDFYNQISIYIQPSVTEGFGIEILEAMAYGRPVIASRGAGGADVISEGIDGFVVPPRNIDAMASKIKWFRDNPRATQIMGENAREKAKHYTWNIIENRYEKVYSELLK